jgi:hypothetical protein
MSRIARLAAAAVLATGLAATVPAASATAGGWRLVDTYPTKVECYHAGVAGEGTQWDDFRCTEHIEPLSIESNAGWDLWVIVYVD